MDTRWAMIIYTAMSTSNMIICRTYIVNAIPDELYEDSQMDGGTPFKNMIKVIIPLSKPIIVVLVLYYGVAKWNDYFNVLLYPLIQKHLVKGVMVGAVKG